MFLSVLLLSAATFHLPALAWGPEYRGALYTLSQTDEQQILVSALFQNGTIEFVDAVPTGGNGTGARGPDPLQSADGLVVQDNYLYAVNPASNDVSIFSFDLAEPWFLTQVGDNIGSGGDYPTTLAVSPDGTKLAVANSGGNGSLRVIDLTSSPPQLVQGFHFDLGLGQSLPPVGPPRTPSDVYFTPDGQQLYLPIKGSGNATEAPAGRVEVFKVDGNNITHQSSLTAATGSGGLPFSMTRIANSPAILLTDPKVGVDILRIEPDGSASYNGSLQFPERASCWSAYSAVADAYIAADIVEGRLTWLSINSTTLNATLQGQYNVTDTAGPAALVDVRVAHFNDSQDFLYSLSASDGGVIRVFSLVPGATELGEPIQAFELGAAYANIGGNLTNSVEGLAVSLRPFVIA